MRYGLIGAFALMVGSLSLPQALASGVDLEAVQRSVRTLVDAPVSAVATSQALAVQCIALSGYGVGVEAAVRGRADRLIETAKDEGFPWGLPPTRADRQCGPGAYDAFQDGTCNPPETGYLFQSSLGLICLSRATLATGDQKYAEYSTEILDRIMDIGGNPCEGCFHPWYSDAENDVGRYVRGNVMLGMAYAWAYSATEKERFATRALEIANSERREAKHLNRAYLGIDDPKRSDNPDIENHSPYVSKSLLDIGLLTGEYDLIDLARHEMSDWINCETDVCRSRSDELSTAPCFIREHDKLSRLECDKAATKFNSFSSYQIWSIYY